MKTSAILLYAGLLSSAVASCKSELGKAEQITIPLAGKDGFRNSERWGDVITKTIEQPSFHSIVLSGTADIKFTQGDKQSVAATGNEKAIEHYNITVKNEVLYISPATSAPKNTPSIKLTITAPVLKTIEINGTGDIDIKNTAEFENDLSVIVSGTGDIDLGNIVCNNLDILINGTGDVKAKKMKCQKANINISGTGDIESEIKAEDINMRISGSGDADLEVRCTNLYIQAKGTGEIEVEGECVNLTKETGGLSRIDTRDLKTQRIQLK